VTTHKIIKTLTAFTAIALITAGCGGSTGSDTATSASGAPTTPSATDAPQLSDQQAPPTRLVIDVTIKGGEVTPTNAQFQSGAKETIVVRVNSDVADQLHVHSNPEHTFNVEPKDGQSFQFTVDVPGKVDIELHDLKRTIGTVTVQ
jgi:ABC-type glycerol-3-phosphate transport system substrate-binding protein